MNAAGQNYATITSLSVRQAYGGLQLTGTKDNPLVFLKEISSDGNVNTVCLRSSQSRLPLLIVRTRSMSFSQLIPSSYIWAHSGWNFCSSRFLLIKKLETGPMLLVSMILATIILMLLVSIPEKQIQMLMLIGIQGHNDGMDEMQPLEVSNH